MVQQELSNVGPITSARATPVRMVLDFFSSIWLGVLLLTLLFVYGAVGSAGMWLPGSYRFTHLHNWVHDIYWMIPWTQFHIRQAPGLEMTEFEWFHWWPFNLLIVVLCINLVVATVRRIPLNIINLGVWMIHSGIIILAVGSVMYFSTKLEGDAPIVRRQVVVNVPGHEPISFIAMPGNQAQIETDRGEVYRFRIMSIDPEWEILSGDDAGEKTYGVAVAVHGPMLAGRDGQQFVRQLLVGFPQYTEDTIWTGNPEQPMARAIHELGTRLVDESIEMELAYAPQEHFYLMDSAALYLREKGETEWVQRPIQNLPRYNEYVSSDTDVFLSREGPVLRPRPLELRVEAKEPGDPLADAPAYVTHYLRYARMQTRRQLGGDTIDPVISIRLSNDQGHVENYEMLALDPERSRAAAGRLRFRWAATEDEFKSITEGRLPMLRVRVPGSDVETTIPAQTASAPDAPFTPIEGTDYAVQVEALQDDLQLGPEQAVSLAIVKIRTPERTFRRWVFDDPDVRNRDLEVAPGSDGMPSMHDNELEFDTAIEMEYQPGHVPAPVTIIAGPSEDELHLMLAIGGREPSVQRLRPGQPVMIQSNIALEVLNYAARTRPERKPFVVPLHQREASARQQLSMIRVHLPIGGGQSVWLPHHPYPFATETEVMRRYPYQPAEVALPDGRVVEVMYSRQRRPLPAPVVLEDFILTTHIGGFTGQTASIRDWTSIVKFAQDGDWTDAMRISMNKPAQFGGFSYFQSQWDPPDQPRFEGDVASQGRNFTVLGVGNRHGVWTQLAGCIIAAIGMIYAFYLKPYLKRRRQQAVYARHGASAADRVSAAAPESLHEQLSARASTGGPNGSPDESSASSRAAGVEEST